MSKAYESLSKFYDSQKKLLKTIVGPLIVLLIVIAINVVIGLINKKSWGQILNPGPNDDISNGERIGFFISTVVLGISGIVYLILNWIYSVIGVVRSVFVRGAGFCKIFYILFCVLNIFFPGFIFILINVLLCKSNLKKLKNEGNY